MITKIKTHKIKYQSNSMIFIWNYDNFIESKQKNNNENQLKINQILKDILKKKDSIVKKKRKAQPRVSTLKPLDTSSCLAWI
jgi:uncharacterized short protein YbdD (DUF466 family)